MRGRDIRRHVLGIAHNPNADAAASACRALGLADRSDIGSNRQATLLDPEKFCAQFLPDSIPADFSALQLPLTVMATDLHRRAEAPLSTGALRPAIAASIAIPGLFRPVTIDGRILIDGGTTNPLPFNVLFGLATLSSRSTCSAFPRRTATTCRAPGKPSTPRSW